MTATAWSSSCRRTATTNAARNKHAGADPATLAWLLEQFHIPEAHPAMGEAGLSVGAADVSRSR